MQRTGAAPFSLAIPFAIAAAWIIAIVAQLTGSAPLLHHHALIEGGPAPGVAALLFILAWLVMIAAMMLPSSLPLMRMFAVVSTGQRNAGYALFAFVGGYVLVWSAFGLVAFGGDVVLHATVDRTPWLAARPWLIAGAILALAGIYQFTPLKDRCLQVCRLPANFLMHHYRRGVQAAFDLGRRHGIFCVGCCWALMLIGFAAGFANLWWMAALTALMVYEKIARRGRRAVPVAGIALLGWSALILAQPAWLPAAFTGIK
ncbi:MAG: DUF2182 domain-containing protein [Candidatus Eremiobacteraeota bacterium]|nr:DUF2182 domain-containing protein [Candidatus Eremiobacteraeota bacterium]